MPNNIPFKSKRLSIAKPDIIEYFEKDGKKIFKKSDISEIFLQYKTFWRASKNTTISNFINFLLNETILEQVNLNFPSRTEIRYTWGKVSFYDLVFSLNTNAYFSHYTAMSIHGLTEQIPKTYYLNTELKPIRIKNQISAQQSIDLAFRNKPRISNNIAVFENKRICILNSKNTNSLGVITLEEKNKEKIRVTDIERTLIDIAVRPIYSGGIYEVLKAYKNAKDKVSINKLVSYLKKIDYTYPYFQVIGFYIEKTGVYNQTQINLLKKFEMKYDFYLTHQIKEMSYSNEWRLFFPKDF